MAEKESGQRTPEGRQPSIEQLRRRLFVAEDDYTKDIRYIANNMLSEDEINARYEELLLEGYKLVQLEQPGLQRLLRKHRGPDHVCIASVTERDVPIYEGPGLSTQQAKFQ